MQNNIVISKICLFLLLILCVSCSDNSPILVDVTFSVEKDPADKRVFEGLSFDINDCRIVINKKSGNNTEIEECDEIIKMPLSIMPKPLKLSPGEYSVWILSNKMVHRGTSLQDSFFYVSGEENFAILGDEKKIHINVILKPRLTSDNDVFSLAESLN